VQTSVSAQNCRWNLKFTCKLQTQMQYTSTLAPSVDETGQFWQVMLRSLSE